MNNLLLVAAVGFGGVLFGFVVGGLVALREYMSDHTDDDLPLCYECRSRVPPEYVVENPAGYPECPVCSGNMLPPGGTRRGGQEGET